MKLNKTSKQFFVTVFLTIFIFSIILFEACSPPCYKKFKHVNCRLDELNSKIDSLNAKIDSLEVNKK